MLSLEAKTALMFGLPVRMFSIARLRLGGVPVGRLLGDDVEAAAGQARLGAVGARLAGRLGDDALQDRDVRALRRCSCR